MTASDVPPYPVYLVKGTMTGKPVLCLVVQNIFEPRETYERNREFRRIGDRIEESPEVKELTFQHGLKDWMQEGNTHMNHPDGFKMGFFDLPFQDAVERFAVGEWGLPVENCGNLADRDAFKGWLNDNLRVDTAHAAQARKKGKAAHKG